MGIPGRRYLCARCRKAVTICSHCDRGHRYCGEGCAHAVSASVASTAAVDPSVLLMKSLYPRAAASVQAP